MSDAEEFVGSGGHVKVGGLLVGEKGVWNPDALEVFGADHEPLDVGQRREDQTRIPPVLAEVDVRREILRFPGFFFQFNDFNSTPQFASQYQFSTAKNLPYALRKLN